jgi:hypothetical protein
LCPDCGGGFEFRPDGTLGSVPVSFARLAGGDHFYPFWVFDAQLGSRAPGRLGALFQERGTLQLYCAGFPDDAKAKWAWSLRLTMTQPKLAAAPRQKTIGGLRVPQVDARILAADLLLTSAVPLADPSRPLDLDLDLSNPRVLAVTL